MTDMILMGDRLAFALMVAKHSDLLQEVNGCFMGPN